jgi:uncharacterized protein YoxC
MTWVGIGLIIIGLGLLALVGIAIKPLNKAATVLSDLRNTTKDLPETVNDISSKANVALDKGVDTLQEVNTQLKELTPIFYLVGDVGRATQHLSSNMVTVVEDFEEKETESFASRKNLEGLYGAITLGIIIVQKMNQYKEEKKIVDIQ